MKQSPIRIYVYMYYLTEKQRQHLIVKDTGIVAIKRFVLLLLEVLRSFDPVLMSVGLFAGLLVYMSDIIS